MYLTNINKIDCLFVCLFVVHFYIYKLTLVTVWLLIFVSYLVIFDSFVSHVG